jgi:hypothetical protein
MGISGGMTIAVLFSSALVRVGFRAAKDVTNGAVVFVWLVIIIAQTWSFVDG